MVRRAERRLQKENLARRAHVRKEDALTADIQAITGLSSFSGIFMSFTLELFDTEEIPVLLDKCKPLLERSEGRLVTISLDKTESLSVRIYEAMHTLFPTAIDCRPIPVEEIFIQRGFQILRKREERITGIPVSIVKAVI